MSTPVTLTDATFAAHVLEADLPVVVDFGAPWCQPCRAIEPAMRELAAGYQGHLVIGAVNVDDAPSSPPTTASPACPPWSSSRVVVRWGAYAAPKARLQEAFEATLATTSATPA